jgi:hypothetical protein
VAHLTPEQLVDLAEGTAAESSAPHLGTCGSCRGALAALRATMADVGGGPDPVNPVNNDVPEPSPLFWDHFAHRIRDQVAEQGAPDGWSWMEGWWRPRVVLPIVATVAGAIVLAVVVSRRPIAPNPIPAVPLRIDESAQLPSLPPLEPLGAPDDPSLGLMADYGTALGWDDMRQEMAVAGHVGATDEAVTTLSADERQELQRLLEEEMTQPSALGAS